MFHSGYSREQKAMKPIQSYWFHLHKKDRTQMGRKLCRRIHSGPQLYGCVFKRELEFTKVISFKDEPVEQLTEARKEI